MTEFARVGNRMHVFRKSDTDVNDTNKHTSDVPGTLSTDSLQNAVMKNRILKNNSLSVY